MVKYRASPRNDEKSAVYTSSKNNDLLSRYEKKKDAIPQVRVIWPWYFRYLLWFFIGIIVYIIISMIIPYFTEHAIISWWNKNGGKDCNQFSVYLMCLYFSFKLGYDIASLNGSALRPFDDKSQALFMLDAISSFTSSGSQFLMPANVCKTIAVPSNRDEGWPDKVDDWKTLLMEWGLPNYKKYSDWKKYQDAITSSVVAAWTRENTENFLYNYYQIPPNAPIIVSFMMNASDNVQRSINYNLFWRAVGLKTSTGAEQSVVGGLWAYAIECHYSGVDYWDPLRTPVLNKDDSPPCNSKSTVADFVKNATTGAFIFSHMGLTGILPATITALGLSAIDLFAVNGCKGSQLFT